MVKYLHYMVFFIALLHRLLLERLQLVNGLQRHLIQLHRGLLLFCLLITIFFAFGAWLFHTWLLKL